MNRKTVTPIVTLMLAAGIALAVEKVQPLDEHYQTARTALAKGDTEKAKRELRLSLQDNPLHSESHFLLASLLGQEGDLDEAIVGFQQVRTLAPNNATARYNLGTAMLWRGENVVAARLLEEAVLIRPDHVPTYNNLAKAYFLVGMPELAVASYEEALRRDPANAIALKGHALLAQSTGGQKDFGSTVPHNASGVAGAPKQAATAVAAADEEPDARAFRELLRDLPHVTVERRGGRLTLAGWTSGATERKLLDKIIAGQTNVLDLTTDDIGDPQRLLEVDATIFYVIGLDSLSLGHDFLRQVTVNASVSDAASAGFGWLYRAAISYEVNIANATQERVALLARPHLSTLSGTSATFIAGGDTVYKVSGTTSGDIKSYPFGTSLDVTPTLLRTQAEDGTPRVRLVVKAGRKSILPVESPEVQATGGSAYANVSVTSEAVLNLNQTLILTGLSQRERTVSRSGVPGLKSVPIIKYLFSELKTINKDLAIIILLTPRDPAFWDEQNQRATADFVEKRRAYLKASQGTPEDMQRFKERYPDWSKLAPNRFASHFFLLENSEVYRRVSGMDLGNESLDYDILGKTPKSKAKF